MIDVQQVEKEYTANNDLIRDNNAGENDINDAFETVSESEHDGLDTDPDTLYVVKR